MRFISLFAGIGGLDLGLERAGHTCVAQVEWDPYCQAVLRKHWPDVPKWSDISDVSAGDLPAADLVVGGFPCQPVSYAGLRRLDADERWLWPEFARIVRMVGPRYVVVENVPGLLNGGLDEVLGGLAGMGFDAEWALLPAADFGAPHYRERLYLVAYSNEVTGRQGLGDIGVGPRQVFAKDHRRRDELWVQAPYLVGRMDDGVPAGAYRHRVGALGNSVVPQVAEWIGHRLMEFS